jgi:hypothetical protein
MSKNFFFKRKIKYKRFFIEKYRKILTLFVIIGGLIIIFAVFVERGSEHEEEGLVTSEEREEAKFFRLIDGEPVSKGEENPFLIAAIIDNHNRARPQFSLSLASLVYDIPTEGGINRYLAFFRSDLEGDIKIGPIRSARPYFLDIAEVYQALLLHCGGSPEALNRIEKENLLTLNEFYRSHYFERYQNYSAPHNVLADFSKIKKYLENNNLEHSFFEAWEFKDDDGGDESRNSFSVQIKSKNSSYSTEWIYDLSSNSYLKKIPEEEIGISAKNIVLQFIESQILDDDLRIKIEMIGEGDAIICRDGSCYDAIWRKEEDKSRTFYLNHEGEEFTFNRGLTWIHFVDQSTSVEID